MNSSRNRQVAAPLRAAFRILPRLAGLALTLALLTRFVDWEHVAFRIASVPATVVGGCVLLAVVRVWLNSIRWRLLAPARDIDLSMWGYFAYMMISTTFNLFLPGAVGGDLARSLLIYKTNDPKRMVLILSIATDRYIGLLSILAIGMVAIFAVPDTPGRAAYGTIALSFLVLLAGTTWCLATPYLSRFVRRVLPSNNLARHVILRAHAHVDSAVRFYLQDTKRILLAFALCLPIHLITFAILYVFAVYDGISISALTLAGISSIVWVVAAIPLSISGLGVRELSFVYLLSMQGVGPDAATALSLQHFAINVILGALGVPFVWFPPRRRRNDPRSCAQVPGRGGGLPRNSNS